MTERQPAPTGEPAAEAPADEAHAEPHPTGTLVLMLLFIVLIVVLWASIYLMLLGRG